MIVRKLIIALFLLVLSYSFVSGQVDVRLFSDKSPLSAVFTVSSGSYDVITYRNKQLSVQKDDPVVILRYDKQLVVKIRNTPGIICDSVLFTGRDGDDSFSLRINGTTPIRKIYSGNLSCFPDMATIVFINNLNIEKYIAGVVEAEGGKGNDPEYFKTQAIIARTYLYRNFNKHVSDRYNLCDNTHCQAYNGISDDPIIQQAVSATKGLVILSQDSSLIASAFHSNCGGETSSSEDVWLINLPYLKRVKDPYCLTSRNATWIKKISLHDWASMLIRSGYKGETSDAELFSFSQKSRVTNYTTGSFTIPLINIRDYMKLRSTFFSVIPEGDSLLLRGRGYGHGVGLCQEGAMVMARKGLDFKQIIDFYYTGVIITDVKNAVILP